MLKQLTGLNRSNGQLLNDHDHIWQSINDILTTPVGSRVMRRDYGSILPDLIDKPLNNNLIMQIFSATAIAVMKWEPRIRLLHVQADFSSGGKLNLTLGYERITEKTNTTQYFRFEIGRI